MAKGGGAREVFVPRADWTAARAVLLEQERVLRYTECFGAVEALQLGCALAALAADYDRGVVAQIVRASDGLVLFQWSMDDKAPRNEAFVAGKRAATLVSGGCSLRCYAEYCLDGSWAEMLDPGSPAMFAGGAFPIRVGDELVATLAVSGLHEGKDHELVVRALAASLGLGYGTDVPAYCYPAL